MPRPNIIYLHSHDTGRFIQPYGYAVRTPNLQRLAEQGVLFRNAHCGNPTCSASRACLLTGQYAHQNGMIGLAHRGSQLNDLKKHLVHTLRDAGYTSALAGIQHVLHAADPSKAGREIGYDRDLSVAESRSADAVAKAAIGFLREKHDKPFFLSLGHVETHRVFPSPAPADDARYVMPPAILPDTPAIRKDWAAYCTMAAQLDEGYGRILGELDHLGLADNTLVICTTDHGVAFPRMKCNLTAHGTGVLLIMRGPGGFAGGKVIDPLVSQLDLFPTLCDLLDIPRPDWLEGKSILPLVEGKEETLHDSVFTTLNVHAAVEPARCVRTARHSYIRRYDGRSSRVMPNCDGGQSKDEMLSLGWRDEPMVAESLHDLMMDPTESHNLASDPRYATVLTEMRQRLADWQKRTNDPLLDGPLVVPGNFRLSAPDDLHV